MKLLIYTSFYLLYISSKITYLKDLLFVVNLFVILSSLIRFLTVLTLQQSRIDFHFDEINDWDIY
jgi:hypothetical protein